jgi:ATP-dependent helicase/nuclease subunit B
MLKLFYEGFSNARRDYLVELADEAIKQGNQVFYILPSREAMFDVRSRVIQKLGGIFNCQIIGFNDFEKHIVGHAMEHLHSLSSNEQKLVLAQTLSQVTIETKDENIFSSVFDKPGFIELLIVTLRRLKRMNLTPDEFEAQLQSMPFSLKEKSESILQIYKAYEYMKRQKGFYDENDLAMKAVHCARESLIFEKPTKIIIDGFINIDPVNIALIQSIEKQPNIDIFVNVPFKNSYNEAFLQSEMLHCFRHYEWEEEVLLADTLAQNLYSGKEYLGDHQIQLVIKNSPCIDHEVREVASMCKKLILEEGVKESQLMITMANPKEYRQALIQIFKEFGVSINLKESTSLLSIPLVKDLTTFLTWIVEEDKTSKLIRLMTSKYLIPEAILQRYDYETDVIAKEILASVDVEQIDLFNVYEATHSADSKESCDPHDVEASIQLPETLKEYTDVLGNFSRFLHLCNTTSEQAPSTVLYDALLQLIDSLSIEKRVLLLYEQGYLDDQMFLRDLQALKQVKTFLSQMKGFSQTLDETYDTCQPIKTQVKELMDMMAVLELRGSSRDLKGVKVMPADLVRGLHFHTVFLLGLNEGVFPGTVSMGGLYNQQEVYALEKNGLSFGTTIWELEREKIRFNSIIAAAEAACYVSYRSANEDGGILIASPFLDDLLVMLPEEQKKQKVMSKMTMRKRLDYADIQYSESAQTKKLLTAYRNDLQDKPKNITVDGHKDLPYLLHGAILTCERESGSLYGIYDGKLTQLATHGINQDSIFSASKLNTYSKCPFLYFGQSILKIDTVDEELQERFDLGTFFHEVLEVYMLRNEDCLTADHELLSMIFDEKKANLHMTTVQAAALDYVLSDYEKMLHKVIDFDAENLQRYHDEMGYQLIPTMMEAEFSFDEEDASGKIYRYTGKIDRIDLEVDARGNYTGRYIVYDYKKNKINSVMESILGIDHQLALYRQAVEKILIKTMEEQRPTVKLDCVALLYYSMEQLKYNGWVRKEYKKALFAVRKGTKSLLMLPNMKVVSEWAIDYRQALIEDMRQGRFMLPKECPNAYYGCQLKGLCRYNRNQQELKKGEKSC